MILIKEVILCQVVIAHWAIFEMTFIDTDGQAKNCKWKKNLKFQNNLTKKKKIEQCQQVIWRRYKKVHLKIEFRI